MQTLKNLKQKIVYFKFLLLGLFFIFAPPLFGQDIEWEENYGGAEDDIAHDIEQTDDGGYIVAGTSSSDSMDVGDNNGGTDYWILKLDNSGTIQWEENYGGAEDDIAHDIEQTNDGGYIVAGTSSSGSMDVGDNNGGTDYWILKLDNSGNLQWEENYGGNDIEKARSIEQTGDGGFIVAGYSHSNGMDVGDNNGGADYWILKLDNSGNLQWEENYGGSSYEIANSIQLTEDGGYIVGGNSQSDDKDVSSNYGSTDCWIVKLDGSGNIQWERNYGGSGGDNAYDIKQTNSGGYIFAGESSSIDNDVQSASSFSEADSWIVRLDGSGNIQWENTYGDMRDDAAHSIQQLSSGNYVFAGKEYNPGDGTGTKGDYYQIQKIDTTNRLWARLLGGGGLGSNNVAYSIEQTDDGDFIVAGNSNSDEGDVSDNNGQEDFWIVKLSGNQNNVTAHFKRPLPLSIYPNPTTDQVTIVQQGNLEPGTFDLQTLTGRTIQSGKLESKGQHTVDVSDVSAGVYLLQVRTDEAVRTKKVIVK